MDFRLSHSRFSAFLHGPPSVLGKLPPTLGSRYFPQVFGKLATLMRGRGGWCSGPSGRPQPVISETAESLRSLRPAWADRVLLLPLLRLVSCPGSSVVHGERAHASPAKPRTDASANGELHGATARRSVSVLVRSALQDSGAGVPGDGEPRAKCAISHV